MSKEKSTKENAAQKDDTTAPTNVICGLVMPISAIDGCTEQHWAEVKAILSDAIETAGFTAHLVSDADDVGVIQRRIIQNLYENPIVVCDVSGKNSNVMFELGMRLAFDKPTIIIKDDKTTYSFDTAPIEHLEYPRDLRFTKIVAFKQLLAEKVEATLKAASEPDYTTFLKHFGKFTVAKLESTELSRDDFMLQQLSDLKELMVHDRMLMHDMMARRDITSDWDTRRRKQSPFMDNKEMLINHIVSQEISRVLEPPTTATMQSQLDDELMARVVQRLTENNVVLSTDEIRNYIRRQKNRSPG